MGRASHFFNLSRCATYGVWGLVTKGEAGAL